MKNLMRGFRLIAAMFIALVVMGGIVVGLFGGIAWAVFASLEGFIGGWALLPAAILQVTAWAYVIGHDEQLV
jgi:hypothetical protein